MVRLVGGYLILSPIFFLDFIDDDGMIDMYIFAHIYIFFGGFRKIFIIKIK